MNRDLVIISFLLVVAGLFFDAYILSILGFLLLIPAIFSSGRQTTSPRPRAPQPSYSAPRPVQPAPYASQMPQTVQAKAAELPPIPTSQPYQQMSTSASQTLFPTTMFPSFTQLQPSQPPVGEPKTKTVEPEKRDEFLELVGLIAVMKLLSS